MLMVWGDDRRGGPAAGEVFRRGRYAYTKSRTRLDVRDSWDDDDGLMQIEVLEYQPVGEWNRPHVYLAIPVFPATDIEIRTYLHHLVAAVAHEFDNRAN